MSFRLFKSILKSILICLASTACDKASSSNTKTSKLACDVGVAATLDAVKKVYTSLIDNEAIKSLSDRSITSTQSLRPTMSQQDFSIALRELDELSSDPSETARLLDDFKEHLYGLSDAPPSLKDKFDQARDLWKSETLKQDQVLDGTEKYTFWKADGISFQDLYLIVGEKMADVSLNRALKAYFLNDFAMQSFFVSEKGTELFRTWIKTGLDSDIHSEFSTQLQNLLVKDGNPIRAEQLASAKRAIAIFFEGDYLREVDNETKELILNLFDVYVKKKQTIRSTSELTNHFADLTLRVRTDWHNSGYLVDDDVVAELKPLIPLVHILRKSIFLPELYVQSRISTPNRSELIEQQVIWNLIILDIINTPTRYLKELMSPQRIDQLQEIVRLSKSYNPAPLMKERETLEQISERINSVPDEQVRSSLQGFIRILKIAGSAGLISAPVWVPFAIIFAIVPEK